MVKIETFVVIDLETTGLPHQEYNKTKITEMSLIAAARKDIRRTPAGELPPTCKLSFMLNPQKQISTASANITGINNDLVRNSPTFKQKFNTIKGFLRDLNKPVCLVAHNGYNFDYKILLAECLDANFLLPDLLCVDSLVAFRQIYKANNNKQEPVIVVDKKSIASVDKIDRSVKDSLSDLLTDDEDEWPDLNVTPEQLQEIDELCLSFQSLSPAETEGRKRTARKVPQKKDKLPGFKLTDIYTRYFGSMDGKTAHRAEDDCLMLLQCMVAQKSTDSTTDFLRWADVNCKLLSDITPLQQRK